MPSLVTDRLHYRESQQTAHGYQEAKENVRSAFVAAKLGYWVKKPIQVEDFSISIQVFSIYVLK